MIVINQCFLYVQWNCVIMIATIDLLNIDHELFFARKHQVIDL